MQRELEAPGAKDEFAPQTFPFQKKSLAEQKKSLLISVIVSSQ